MLLVLCVLALAGVIAVGGVNAYMLTRASGRILTREEAARIPGVDCVLVLGCLVRGNGQMSGMLKDRVNVGLSLYDAGVSNRLLMSGDHGHADYDEVNAMKSHAVSHGVDPDCVFCDHAGFSTYESMYRAKEIFGVERVVIVTQQYHLPRAIFIAEQMGMEAWGVSASLRPYGGQTLRTLREVAARCKDLVYCILRPEPTYLGEKIPITGLGSATDG